MITGKYKEFYARVKHVIPSERLLHDSLSTLAFGTDASFYRLIPKLIIRAGNEEEIKYLLTVAHDLRLPVTFRAAGTSLSGQAQSDSILIIASHGFNGHKILNNGEQIMLQPGLRGGYANSFLIPYGRKIGPDPASIDSAMIGGIAANNASGMCCGTSENSYKTIADIRIILADGTLLDTSKKESREAFAISHKDLLNGLEEISANINSNEELRERIKKKYKIKNTTGYSLNAFVDFNKGFDILKHLIIGSEGTLAFIAGITYNTVIEHKYKALALALYSTIDEACKAVQILKGQPVSAVELIDRAGIRSVENANGIPSYLKSLSNGACALLIETRAKDDLSLENNIKHISESIECFKTELPYTFTKDAVEQATLWKIRKETLPTVAGMRKPGTTSIIEDVCFPVPKLAQATMELRQIFAKNGYDDAVIFGHALAGNLHFMFNQDFGNPDEIERYAKFMDDITQMVVNGYDGSLKAEHGTGRNMAPFVELEWGKQAYNLMLQVKELFDPYHILNPGVILNSNKNAHIENLKPCPDTSEIINKCMECGFCERGCVAEGLTLSPRQRVATYREVKRLENNNLSPHIAAEIRKEYSYWGDETCATDSLCAVLCPVKVDTGKLIKSIRAGKITGKGEKQSIKIADNIGIITQAARSGLNCLFIIRKIVGKRLFGLTATAIRKISFCKIPLWNEYFPKGAHKIHHINTIDPITENNVVYFPSCITRSMGRGKNYEVEITRITEELLKKGGYNIIYPEHIDKLCCGMAFSSKGYVKAGQKLSDELMSALIKASNNKQYPILCDMSPCLYTMHANMDESLKLYEPAEFIDKFLLKRLKIRQLNKKIAIFAVCSAKKLGVDDTLYRIAKLCAKEVIIVDSNCCGFAGDRGFTYPELNKHGLRNLKEQIKTCSDGYATSRTCEIGLSYNGGIDFKSILYLLNEASEPKDK